MGKIIIPTIIIALFVISLISAPAPPPFVSSELGELQIQFPLDNQLELNQNYTFHFHVFNSSTGFPVISGLSCDFHLYNKYGNHQLILNTSIIESTYDYEFYVGGTNFSEVGNCHYILNCNNSNQGGFVATSVEITQSGEELTTAN